MKRPKEREEAITKILDCTSALESIFQTHDLEITIAALNILNTHSHNILQVFLQADLFDARIKHVQLLVKQLHARLSQEHGVAAASAVAVCLRRAVREMDRCLDDLLDGEPN